VRLRALTQLRANHGLSGNLIGLLFDFFFNRFFSSAVDQNRCRRLSYFRQIVLVHLFLPISLIPISVIFSDFEREREREK